MDSDIKYLKVPIGLKILLNLAGSCGEVTNGSHNLRSRDEISCSLLTLVLTLVAHSQNINIFSASK